MKKDMEKIYGLAIVVSIFAGMCVIARQMRLSEQENKESQKKNRELSSQISRKRFLQNHMLFTITLILDIDRLEAEILSGKEKTIL